MKNILITAIGSMSVECVIKQLRKQDVFIVGCDIYPTEWHYESKLCDVVYKAPLAKNENEYIDFLVNICKKNSIKFLLPSTDLEIDIINKNRKIFEELNIILCIQNDAIISIVRNKFNMFNFFANNELIKVPETYIATDNCSLDYPFIAKPCDGRSSEGLRIISNNKDFDSLPKKNYIIQKLIKGNIITIDYIRDRTSGIDVAIPRKELIRTKNGAGLTVEIITDSKIFLIAKEIGKKLNIHGCINFELIQTSEDYFLIDINPRFSAGIAFSVLAGYDFVNNHLRCFEKAKIDKQNKLCNMILSKKYQEVVLSKNNN